nr:hypothetical protein [Tanacetum cinerariifolium]
MVSFRQLHSHLKRLSQNDLNGTRTESGFKRAFATLFGQDIETFTSAMFLNTDVDNRKKVDTGKALDVSLVDIESNGTESNEQDTCSKLGNDAHSDDEDIKPIYDEEPMAEVQTTAEINVFVIGQPHTEQPEFNNEGEVDQNAKE